MLNPNIILAGQSPDILNALANSNVAAQQRVEFDRTNAMNRMFQEQGAGIIAGDQNALNALAGYDPMAALGVQDARLGMDATRLGMDATRQQMEVLDIETKRAAEEYARGLSKEQAAAEAAQLEAGVKQALMAPNAAAFDALMTQMGRPELVGQFENRQMLAGQFMSVAEILKMQEGEKPTDDIREYEFARSQGYQGTFQQYLAEMKKAGASTTTIDMNGNPRPELLGTQGLVAIPDPKSETGWRVEPAPGSPLAEERRVAEEKKGRTRTQGQLKLGTTLTSINLNLAELESGGMPVAGIAGDARRTPLGRLLTGDSAVDFDNRTRQITDSAAFAEIQNMRDNSPTGGAVGQLTDQERQAIGNAVTALNSSTSAPEYARAAKAYRELALNLAFGEGKWKLNEDGTVEAISGSPDAPEAPTPPKRLKFNPETGELE